VALPRWAGHKKGRENPALVAVSPHLYIRHTRAVAGGVLWDKALVLDGQQDGRCGFDVRSGYRRAARFGQPGDLVLFQLEFLLADCDLFHTLILVSDTNGFI
jgi:hypothetical protein